MHLLRHLTFKIDRKAPLSSVFEHVLGSLQKVGLAGTPVHVQISDGFGKTSACSRIVKRDASLKPFEAFVLTKIAGHSRLPVLTNMSPEWTREHVPGHESLILTTAQLLDICSGVPKSFPVGEMLIVFGPIECLNTANMPAPCDRSHREPSGPEVIIHYGLEGSKNVATLFATSIEPLPGADAHSPPELPQVAHSLVEALGNAKQQICFAMTDAEYSALRTPVDERIAVAGPLVWVEPGEKGKSDTKASGRSSTSCALGRTDPPGPLALAIDPIVKPRGYKKIPRLGFVGHQIWARRTQLGNTIVIEVDRGAMSEEMWAFLRWQGPWWNEYVVLLHKRKVHNAEDLDRATQQIASKLDRIEMKFEQHYEAIMGPGLPLYDPMAPYASEHICLC